MLPTTIENAEDGPAAAACRLLTLLHRSSLPDPNVLPLEQNHKATNTNALAL